MVALLKLNDLKSLAGFLAGIGGGSPSVSFPIVSPKHFKQVAEIYLLLEDNVGTKSFRCARIC
jgi:hypothetical protein